MLKSLIHKSLQAFGLDLVRFRSEGHYPPDFRTEEIDIIKKVRPWTMTSLERIYSLIQATRYLSANGIEGAIVECGVWKGGSIATIARTLVELSDVERELYLFDTFEGMSAPTEKDFDYDGIPASEVLRRNQAYYCADAPLETVKRVLAETGYPMEKIHFVTGRVEDTIPANSPNSISLLRLDTDWYQSTKHELIHLFPLLSTRGVIVIDDYGHWSGARQACEEYFEENRIAILLNRIDYTGRLALKL